VATNLLVGVLGGIAWVLHRRERRKEEKNLPEVLVGPADPDGSKARWCLERYYEDLDRLFEGGFELDRSLVPDAGAFAGPDGIFLLATIDGRPVACGGVKRSEPQVGYIKRMWVDPTVRGRGLGRRMLRELEDAARELGCASVQLETNGALETAIRMYRKAGYEEVPPFNDEPYAHHWFRKTLRDGEP
jgi:ribosomal protein S18 acetylase RimI-like enzyme